MVTSATAPPLLVSQDDDLAAEIARLAAVAGCDLRRGADPAEAGQLWREAPLVLLDERTAAQAAAAGMPRRSAILLVCRAKRDEQWRSAFEIGADAVLQLPEQEAQLVELLAEAVDAPVSGAGRVLAVLGGTGGAGASTLAAAVSVTAARRGDRALLLDCDPLGGGLDLTVGVERTEGLRWSGLAISGGRVAAGALREALPGRRVVPACSPSCPATATARRADSPRHRCKPCSPPVAGSVKRSFATCRGICPNLLARCCAPPI